jgi:flagellar biosynthesis/type III secretory pathway M-ring protein FliF/YscJ
MKRILLLLVVFFTVHVAVFAQREKKRPPKEKQKTAEEAQAEAIEKKKAKEAENMAKYQDGVDHHKSLQDKATQKRMKKNLKRAEKQSWGKNVPWYKRWFRKKHI